MAGVKNINALIYDSELYGKNNGVTRLYRAISSNNIKEMLKLIEKGADINKEVFNGETPLIVSIKYNISPSFFEILIKRGVDINKGNTINGETPLYIACKKNNLEVVKALLKGGSNINQITVDGKSVLEYANKGEFSPEINDLIILQRLKQHRGIINKFNAVKSLPETGIAPPSQLPNEAYSLITEFISEKKPYVGGRRKTKKRGNRRTKKTKKTIYIRK